MKKHLCWYSPIRGISGYASYARKLLTSFYNKYGDEYYIQVKTYPWQEYDVPIQDDDESEIINRLEKNRINPNEAILVNWTLSHEFHPFCKYNIGYTLFETDRITDKWRIHCNKMDEIWVSSTFNQETFWNSGVSVPIRVVPGGVEDRYFDDDVPKFINEVDTEFNFVTAGQWIPIKHDRKNIDKVMTTFLKAFNGNRNVGLFAKVYGVENTTMDYCKTLRRIQKLKHELGVGQFPRIYLIHGVLEDEHINSLLHQADAAILPSPEGWGMWHIQSAASGIPVITQDWSAYTDFLDTELTPMIKHEKMVHVDKDMKLYMPYKGKHLWADLDLTALKNTIIDVYTQYGGWKEKAEQQRENIRNNWTWDCAAEKMYSTLEKAWDTCEKPPHTLPVIPYLSTSTVCTSTVFHGAYHSVINMVKSGIDMLTKHDMFLFENGFEGYEDDPYRKELLELVDSNERLHLYSSKDILSFTVSENKLVQLIRDYVGNDDFYVLFLDHTVLFDNWVMVEKLAHLLDVHDDVGCVGCKILDEMGNIFTADTRVVRNEIRSLLIGNGESDDGQYDYCRYVDSVGGACYMWRYSDFKSIDGYDEKYFISYKNIDIQERLKQMGRKILYNGKDYVRFDTTSEFTMDKFDVREKYKKDREYFIERWEDAIMNKEVNYE